jgi:nickel/cobalt transporter (NicO) family protein
MKNKLFLAMLLLAGSTLIQPAWAQNPFFGAPAQEEKSQVVEERSFSGMSPHLVRVNALQREFREKMTGYARQIQTSPTGGATISFLALTFAYGVIHALGPGHGKAIVGSYFLSRRGTFRQAILFGNLITFMHVLSATAIVFGLTLIGRNTNIFAVQEAEGGLQSFSYFFIFLIGLFLLFRAAREILAKRKGVEKVDDARADAGSMATLSLSAGLVPCPGAALILLFTLSLDILWAGLVAMIFLGAGMGLTNSLVGVATLGSRNAILRLTSTSPKLFRISYSLLAVSGALIITLLGLTLFLGNIGPIGQTLAGR